ncbi:hypothetical protein I6G82_02135 [Lysinibacillus macroides]|uniref:Glycosyl hydrolase family 88 n=1 Tax=Lysinibacillus macroides TaxID=33935 RepID=A0A0M9DJC7_9BACI|nr:hypothetical protein [Lysinibacillus macroides]KOY81372.1 hypothetical protein ADM90_19820 [Lysinibacillus macroides]QPR68455.1 hypothetical protein I6G82_02135 [Lysinibacillus macroides]
MALTEPKYISAVTRVVDHGIRTLVLPDGRTCEYAKVDQLTGTLQTIYNKNALDYDTVWSRGHAWTIYGLIKAYSFCKNDTYFEVINKVTNIYINQTKWDLIPNWDLFANKDDILDTSAAAAVCSAFIKFGKVEKDLKYLNLGKTILNTLLTNDYLSSKKSHQGILLHASTPLRITSKPGESQIWGDYFLLEALNQIMK